jgi:GT2 family glycosyltransferase
MTNRPEISVVIGSYNRLKFLKLAIESIRQELENLPSEIIVIEGGSNDGTLKWLMSQKDIVTIVQHNRGKWKGKEIERKSWGYFMNLGFKCAQAKYVCMLSDDCLVVPGAIINGHNLLRKKTDDGENVGALAFYWRNWPDQKNYNVGLTLGRKMFVNHGIYLKKALEDVGYIDEDSYFFYHADGDLCLKMWSQGYSIFDSPDSYIEHYSHANHLIRKSNLINIDLDWKTYVNKWNGTFYDEKGKFYGSWIEKEFHDPWKTANKYKVLHVFNIRYKIIKIYILMKKLLKRS